MTLPVSGQISLSQINTELGRSSTTEIHLGESAVRGLAGIPSGQIAMSNLHGKSSWGDWQFEEGAYYWHLVVAVDYSHVEIAYGGPFTYEQYVDSPGTTIVEDAVGGWVYQRGELVRDAGGDEFFYKVRRKPA